MIGYDDCRCPCIFCLQCSSAGHDTLDDERHTCHLCHIPKLIYRLAARRRCQILQKRKSCSVNIHSNCKRTGCFYQLHFLPDRLQIPWLNCWDAQTTSCFDRCGGSFHYFRIGSITGKCSNPAFCTGIHQKIVVSQIVIFLSVMQCHCSYRTCKKRILECPSKELNRSIDRLILMNGIHVHTDLLPFLIITNCIISYTFGPWSRHLIFTCCSITDRTDLTVRTHISSCGFQYFIISHLLFLL